MKNRLGCLSNKSDSYSDFTAFLPSVPEKSTRCIKLSTEEAIRWTESFDILLSHKYGLAAFRAFLHTEFSEENIEFWMACEDYKKTKSTAKLGLKAKKIYEEFIDVQAAREVNIDFQTREMTRRNLQEPTPSCFDDAQGKVHSLMEKDSYPRPSLQEALKWRETFDKLLTNKHGLAAFRAFLKSEFSEENIEFWLACEDYKNTKSSAKLSSKAKTIYEEYFENDAPKEVNIDHETRKITKNNLLHPSLSCFDLAQNQIYTLMEKDSYSRFLKSSTYQELTKKPMCSCIQQQNSSKKPHT
ncbi:Regulator of G-protein signaling 8 [Acipenser ruthenus]|uniref:Regulator of G-protein signaling 8 n=1 Tax=Acipenser ruthenus TaxID=7906 RepID=A0A662YV71_ACIRT|nr:Regulator of G-protein signaling 8 [Acipenser ruthenus]